MKLEAVIGLEVHAQLKTNTKIFCGCPTAFGAEPNHQVCPVCLGMPGVLPVLNKKAVEHAIKAGTALNCSISESTHFDRKNYFYPDSSKGYQISQYDQAICVGGHLIIDGKKIRIHRAHLEEDAGKLVHSGAAGLHGSDYSNVDFNRCGTPLLEIVTEPDISSPDEARLYLQELRNILRYIDVCDGNLEEGSFRCDANISMRPVGQKEFGTKTEVKNMNSFKAVQRAIQSEIERQTLAIMVGERVVQETRLWNDATGTTHVMRSKEEAHDYRYFPEPDLVPLSIDRKWVEEIVATIAELPEAKRKRYTEIHGLSAEDAGIFTDNKELAEFFDKALDLKVPAKQASNHLLGTTLGYLKESKKEFAETALTPENLRDIISASTDGKIGSTIAKQLLLELLAEKGDVFAIIEKRGLAQVNDEGALRDQVQKVLDASPAQLEQYKGGSVKVRQYFFGEVMKAMKGKANPQVINKMLDELLPTPASTT